MEGNGCYSLTHHQGLHGLSSSLLCQGVGVRGNTGQLDGPDLNSRYNIVKVPPSSRVLQLTIIDAVLDCKLFLVLQHLRFECRIVVISKGFHVLLTGMSFEIT